MWLFEPPFWYATFYVSESHAFGQYFDSIVRLRIRCRGRFHIEASRHAQFALFSWQFLQIAAFRPASIFRLRRRRFREMAFAISSFQRSRQITVAAAAAFVASFQLRLSMRFFFLFRSFYRLSSQATPASQLIADISLLSLLSSISRLHFCRRQRQMFSLRFSLCRQRQLSA